MQRQITGDIEGKKEVLLTLMELNGFVPGTHISSALGRHQSTQFRHALRENGVREHIVSTGHGVKTNCGRKYSAADLFGHNVFDYYFVIDFDAFREYATKKYSVKFANANPNADRDLVRAYTRFMRKNLLDAPRPTPELRQYA